MGEEHRHYRNSPHQGTCPECQELNRNYIRQNQSERRQRNRLRIDEFKSQPCADCKRSFVPEAMELIPLDRKVGKPWLGVLQDLGIERLEQELAYLEPVCCNCVRIRATHTVT